MRMLLPESRELDDEALRAAYAVEDGRRMLRAGFIESLDGAASVSGSSHALGSPDDLRLLLTLRELADVVLVGAGTVRAEGYGSLGLDDAAMDRRHARGASPEPRLAIMGRSLDLGASESVLGNDPIIVTTQSADRSKLRGSDVLIAGRDEIDPNAVLDGLAERGLLHVQCEGGPTLFGAFASAGLVDELCLTLSPTIALGDSTRISAHAPEAAYRMRLGHVLESDGYLFLRYQAASASSEWASTIS